MKLSSIATSLVLVLGAVAAGGPATAADVPPGSWTLSKRGPALDSGFIATAADGVGNVYGVQHQKGQVLKVNAYGRTTIVAGNGSEGEPVTGEATESPFRFLRGVAVDRRGSVLVADYGARRVLAVSPSGRLSIVAGSGEDGSPVAGSALDSPLTPGAMTIDGDGNLFVLDLDHAQIVRITPAGRLDVVAGTGDQGTATEGPAQSSPLGSVGALDADSRGNLFATDGTSMRVLKISTAGRLSFVAGTGNYGSPAPGPALESDLASPFGLAIDPDDTVYVTETTAAQVLAVSPAGQLSVVAGSGATTSPTDGPALSSGFDGPFHLSCTGLGSLTVADNGTQLVDLTLNPATTTTTAVTSRLPRYGSTTHVSVTVTGARSGAITLRRGAQVLDRGTLSNGSARLTIKPTALRPGTHGLTVDYLGHAASAPSSRALSVTVRKASAKATLSPRRTRLRTRERLVVTGHVTAPGLLPTGTVVVKDGRRTLATRTLRSAARGRTTISLPRLSRGKHALRLEYRGSSLARSAVSARRTVTVVR